MRGPKKSVRNRIGRGIIVFLASVSGALASGPGADTGGGDSPADGGSTLTVAGVLERYVQACGGPELAKVKAEKRKGTLVRGQSGQVPFTTISGAAGKWLYSQVFAYGDQVSYGCDGTAAWLQDTRGVDSLSGAMRLDLEMLLDVQAPLRIRELFPEMRLLGVDNKDGRETVLIQAVSRDGRSTELAFDKESGFLLRAGDLAFEDYRPVGRVKRPHRVYIGDDPSGLPLRLKMEFKEMVPNPPLEESAFGRPQCALPMKESPLYKVRRYAKLSDEALQACVGVYRHPTNPALTYSVTRQRNHLLMEGTGWGQALEIMPESELDFSIRFLNFEVHFVRDDSGRVMALELGSGRSVRAERIQ